MNRMTSKEKEDIRQDYFEWLCGKINRRGFDPGYDQLIDFLFHHEFFGITPNDNNRAVDGTKLREAFETETGRIGLGSSLGATCTMLEMLIALSERMGYILSRAGERTNSAKWFWLFIKNLGLKPYLKNDPRAEGKNIYNDIVLKKFVERTYAENGKGGLFPLEDPTRDQRKVEIWYQMQAYIRENFEIE